MEFETSAEVPLPKDPLEMIIGQEEAVRIARLAAGQHRHLLLVGPPGTGKSMIAKAMAFHIPRPTEEILVLHNPRNPERPIPIIHTSDDLRKEEDIKKVAKGKIRRPEDVPRIVSERLGFACMNCGQLSDRDEDYCPGCSQAKFKDKVRDSPFSDLLSQVFNVGFYEYPEEEVHLSSFDKEGNEEIRIYQAVDNQRVREYDPEALEGLNKLQEKRKSKTIVPLKRSPFVQATGASETELLGDVKHDPWGGMPEAGGQMPYQRVIPGAIHEAHQGVLFVDELPQLGRLQHHLLTAMQERHFHISGMNPTSSGAAVKVERVPCNFVFVGACNINELEHILPPLRSRILGNGYEVLLETVMPKNAANSLKLAQFFAQEVLIDQKIPHGSKDAISALIREAERRALEIDGAKGAYTLRLRGLGGVIRLAGDLAKTEEAELITAEHVKRALKSSKSVEQQLVDKYGSVWQGQSKDHMSSHIISEEKKARGYV